MVREVLTQVDATVPIKTVHATRGKRARAEPVAAFYEQGRVSHVGGFAALGRRDVLSDRRRCKPRPHGCTGVGRDGIAAAEEEWN